MRKIIAVFLCICTILFSVSTPVFAIETGVDDAVLEDEIFDILSIYKQDDSEVDAGDIFNKQVHLSLSNASVASGDQVILSLDVTENVGFSGMCLNIRYDPAAMTLSNVTSSVLSVSFSEKSGHGTIIISNPQVDEKGVALDYTGTGEIAKLTFTTKSVSGDYDVSFDDSSQIFGYNGNILNDGYTDGKITISCSHTYSDTYVVLREAGCETEGLGYKSCTKCGYVLNETIAPLGHTSGTWRVYRPATCTNEGIRANCCDRCDKVLEYEAIAVIEHSMAWVVTKKPTCTEEGTQEYMCIVCGGERGESKTIEKVSHIAGEEKVIKEPTCKEEGTLAVICKNCPEVLSATPIAKLPHAKTKLIVVTAPTSESEGVGEYRCTECDEVTETVTFEKTESRIYGKEDVAVYRGDTVRIAVVIEHNSGFSYGVIRINYDKDSLSFVGVSAGDVTEDITMGSLTEGQISLLVCPADNETRKNGTLFYLEFTVKENAESSYLDIYYNPQSDFSDKEGNRLFFNLEGVTIAVKKFMTGDVNGDKKVDTSDLALMKLYLVGAEKEIGGGADIDMDGKVDTLDLAFLKLHLAGNITLE